VSDDKGAGEGPYTVKEENGVSNLYLHKLRLEGHTRMFLMDLKMLCEALNTAHCVGVKSERDRCLEIVEKLRAECGKSWYKISDEIGGRDGK
jgi:hypothetical protein